MSNNQGTFTLFALVAFLFVSCNLVNTTPAPLLSAHGDTVPVIYSLSPVNNVVMVSVDRSKEGVVLSAAMDEYELPTVWAKVVQNGATYTLYNKTVDVTGFDAASFVLAGGTYFAKNIKIGIDADARILSATVSGTSVVYTYGDPADATKSITLPDAALSDANKKWYWDQMTAGNYFVLNSTGAEFADLDYTKDNLGNNAFTTVTKTNRWLKSSNDAAWKAGRDASLVFVQGKVLTGAKTQVLTTSAGTWRIGIDDTLVVDTWNFDTYFTILLNAYKSENTVDVTTSPSS